MQTVTYTLDRVPGLRFDSAVRAEAWRQVFAVQLAAPVEVVATFTEQEVPA